MKKFVFAVVFAVAAIALPLSSSCSKGPTCKKVICKPDCSATTQYCDLADTTCKDFKMCSPACMAGQYCDVTKGSCVNLCSPVCGTGQVCDNGTCKAIPGTCSPACTGTDVCNNGTCGPVLVCSPVCDLAGKGEVCTN